MITSSSYLYPGVPVYQSKDLINWKLIGHCLTRPAHYFPDKNNNKPEIYAGPWSDPICIDRPVFDPSLYFDEDGKVYYTRRGEFTDKDI